MPDVRAGYAAAATPELIARYEAVDPLEWYAPVLDLFPQAPGRVLDVGAGTGRDAAWLAAKGHRVLAVEPVAELRQAGMRLHASAGIAWLDDTLPGLAETRRHGRFGLLLLSGVWQHLDDDERRLAMATLAGSAAPRALMIMSLRHGEGASGRPAVPVVPEETISAACSHGFKLERRAEAASIQAGNRARGVSWTWLALSAP